MRKKPEERSPKGVDKSIREAMESGQFDNLPGAGKPLPKPNPFERPEDWAVNQMLKNNDIAPAWIEARKAVEGDRERLLDELAWAADHVAGSEEDWARRAWQQAVETFRIEAEKLNRRIRDANLISPAAAAELKLIQIERRIREAGGE